MKTEQEMKENKMYTREDYVNDNMEHIKSMHEYFERAILLQRLWHQRYGDYVFSIPVKD